MASRAHDVAERPPAASGKIGGGVRAVLASVERFGTMRLVLAAVAIWGVSLLMTGLVLDGRPARNRGYEILLMGWLGVLIPSVAWLANLFFGIAVMRLGLDKTAHVPAWIAAVLSLDTFRVFEVPVSAAPSYAPVFGYGWGAVLWVTSMFVLLAAAGVRQGERKVPASGSASLGLIVGVTCALLMPTLAMAKAVVDRSMASTSEARRLDGVAFKRGWVCSRPDPTPTDTLQGLSGALELTVEAGHGEGGSRTAPFDSVMNLLRWGVPVVRFRGEDHELVQGASLMRAVPAAGQIGARLAVRSHDRSISLVLVSLPEGRELVRQTWVSDLRRRCPDYHSYPSEAEQPRKVLVSALNIDSAAAIKPPAPPRVDRIPVDARLLPREVRSVDPRYARESDRAPRPVPFAWNVNCPGDIGWRERSWDIAAVAFPRVFHLRDTKYYQDFQPQSIAVCQGDDVYLFVQGGHHGKESFSVTKRSLIDFAPAWPLPIVYSIENTAVGDGGLLLERVREGDNELRVDMRYAKSGREVTAVVSLPFP